MKRQYTRRQHIERRGQDIQIGTPTTPALPELTGRRLRLAHIIAEIAETNHVRIVITPDPHYDDRTEHVSGPGSGR